VPQDPENKLRALQAAEKLHFWGFVTGHDFSRADKANEINRALAPAEVPWAKFLEIKPFSAACLAPEGILHSTPSRGML
jgi:hypothetical protein